MAMTRVEAFEGEEKVTPYWTMDWGEDRNRVKHPDRYEVMFEEGVALGLLLLNQVVFANSYWWKSGKMEAGEEGGIVVVPDPEARWTEEEGKLTSLSVACNDVFAWASSDAEMLPYREIRALYDMWLKDPEWGAAVWCCKQRGEMPQRPVAEIIRKAGKWDLAGMGLKENGYDKVLERLKERGG